MTVGELIDMMREVANLEAHIANDKKLFESAWEARFRGNAVKDEPEIQARIVSQGERLNAIRELPVNGYVVNNSLCAGPGVADQLKPSAVAAVEKTDEWGDVVDKLHSARDEIVLLRHKLYEVQKIITEAALASDHNDDVQTAKMLRRALVVMGEDGKEQRPSKTKMVLEVCRNYIERDRKERFSRGDERCQAAVHLIMSIDEVALGIK